MDRILTSARLQQLGHAADIHDAEVTKVLESLVADNEALKRDNAEYQNLLAAEREELHTLQEELEERRASDTPFRRGHRFTHSGTSNTYHDTSAPLSPTFQIGTAPTGSVLRSRLQSEKAAAKRRSLSAERSRERMSRQPFVSTLHVRPAYTLAENLSIGASHPRDRPPSYIPCRLSHTCRLEVDIVCSFAHSIRSFASQHGSG